MLHPLRSHIIFLENTIQSLRNRLTGPGLAIEELEDIELQLSLSEGALDHYGRAYALELKVSGTEPPNDPTGSEPNASGQGPEKPSSTKKKEGLAAAESRVCRRVPRAKCSPSLPARVSVFSKTAVGQMEAAGRFGLSGPNNAATGRRTRVLSAVSRSAGSRRSMESLGCLEESLQ